MKRIALFALPFLALSLAACGGGSKDGKSSSVAPDQAKLRYAKCMRDNGVNMPDDDKALPSTGLEIPDKAQKACEKWEKQMGGKTIDMKDPATRDRFTKLARCMRGQGIDFPDPGPNGEMPPPDFDGGNRTKFDAALKVCAKHLPGGGQ